MNESTDDSKPPIDMESISILVPRARSGDALAREAICRQVQDYLQLMADQHLDKHLRSKLNPSDVVQLAMTRMINGFEDFRGQTRNEFYGWLTRILKNEINTTRRDLHREKRDIKRERELVDEKGNPAVTAVTDPSLTPGSRAIRDERRQQLEAIMSALPKEMAEVIRLRTLEDLPFQQVADKMNKSYDAVSKLWRRAIGKFQAELDKCDDSMS